MTETFKIDEILVTPAEGASLFAQHQAALKRAVSVDINEYFRLLGMKPEDIVREYRRN